MNRQIYFIILPLLVLSFLSGCATVMTEKTKQINLNASNDQKVKVLVIDNGSQYTRELPTTISTKPRTFSNVNISIIDSDYKKQSYNLPKHIHPSYWLNIFNIHGFYIDALTSAMWDYDSNISVPVESGENPEHNENSTVSFSENSLPKNETELFSKHSFGFGLIPTNFKKEGRLNGVGKYASYEYKLTDKSAINVRFSRMYFNCRNTILNTRKNDSCFFTYGIKTEQSAITATFNQNVISDQITMGLGTGVVKVKQTYHGKLGVAPPSESVYTPIFLEFAYKTKEHFKVNLFGNMALSMLGLGNAARTSLTDNSAKLPTESDKVAARTELRAAEQFSRIGVGVEWNTKSQLGIIGSIILNAYIYNI